MMHHLLEYPDLNLVYFKEKGITQAIAELATKRFANQNIRQKDFSIKVNGIIDDLIKGRDTLTEMPLPNFGNFRLPEVIWQEVRIIVKDALFDCAIKI